jgi:hypothetical protein
MRVAVIRGDLSKPLFLADLEPKSQTSSSVETAGQNRYLSRPDATKIADYLTAQGLVASASGLITATVPVGGPVDVSSATITGVAGLGGATVTQVTALQDFLAPRIVETDVAKKSFLFGNMAGYRSASFNPDTRSNPPRASSAAISVVADDGVTAFAVAQPVVSVADKDTPGAGALRITGTGLLGYGMYETSVVLVDTLAGPYAKPKHVTQAQILLAGGSVTGTQIDIPASLVPGIAVGTWTARVSVNDMLSAAVALS